MKKQLVSIIVPSYNQAQYLDEALQSVLDQVYQEWECIIVNDGSPDNTREIAEKWTKKDSRFVYLEKINSGLSGARNYGIERAKGIFILPLDADDRISSEYISLAVKSFEANNDIKVVYCKAEKFGDDFGIWELPEFSRLLLCERNLIFCSAMFRKSDWQTVGGYDLKMIYGWEDWEFWIAVLKNGGEVKCLDEIGFYYRIKETSMLKQLDESKINYLYEYISIKHADFFVTQLGSFQKLLENVEKAKNENNQKLKSEKFVIDAFCSRFFGFSVFGIYKNKKQT